MGWWLPPSLEKIDPDTLMFPNVGDKQKNKKEKKILAYGENSGLDVTRSVDAGVGAPALSEQPVPQHNSWGR